MTEDDDVPIEQPPGVRACRDGGRWEPCDGAIPWGREVEAIRTVSRSPQDFALLKREIARYLLAATQGGLTYGPQGEVVQMNRARSVLELRFHQRVQYPDGARVVRLYYSEPTALPGVLLSAKVGAKPATQEGLDLQDEHIEEALVRIRHHLGL